MSYSNKATVLAATTDAAASEAFMPTEEGQTITIQVVGLANSEKAYLQIENVLSAGSYVNYKYNGSNVYCDAGNNVVVVGHIGKFRINKDASAGAVGVVVMSYADIKIG